ncbi:MAG: DUF4097 family beta strand repeat protein [Opitutae bacterium]|nr:DUF4097 family beta strand repeat protein [Opitutae bacterium]
MKLFSLLAFACACATLAPFASATVTEKFSQTYPLAADGTIHLDGVNGSVEITAWDRNEVSLEAEKRAPDEDNLRRIRIEVDATSGRLAIKTRYEKKHGFLWFAGNTRGEVRYKLMVPAGARLDKIDVVNADITVQGVKGYVNLDTVNGAIEARGLGNAGRFDTVNGSIKVDYDSFKFAGKVVLDTVNGSCRITVPKDAGFELNADSVNGRIHCDLPITLERSGSRHLRGTVGGGGVQLKLDSVNGSLTVNSK